MSGYKTQVAVLLVDANGRPIGFKEQDGDETFFPVLSTDQASLVLPNGSSITLATPGVLAIASQILAALSLVYVKGDGELALADATAEGKEALGFVASAYAADETATFSTSGSTITGFADLTPGATYYMSTTPGAITITPPATAGNVVQVVGVALSATSLLFAPQAPITL